MIFTVGVVSDQWLLGVGIGLLDYWIADVGAMAGTAR